MTILQVGKLGSGYDKWVHDPIVQKEPPRFFESDIAEVNTCISPLPSEYSVCQWQKLRMYLSNRGKWARTLAAHRIIVTVWRLYVYCGDVPWWCLHWVKPWLCEYRLQFFTQTAWWVIPVVWMPLVIQLGVMAYRHGLWLTATPFTMGVGAFIWTFIEYLLHRFVFHMQASNYWWVRNFMITTFSCWFHGKEYQKIDIK